MANEEQLAILRKGVKVWNKWRESNPNVDINLKGAQLGVTDLSGAMLDRADLQEVDLIKANLVSASLVSANLQGADLGGANLTMANLSDANLDHVNLFTATLDQANLVKATMRQSNLTRASLVFANLSEVDLFDSSLNDAILRGANLSKAILIDAALIQADLSKARLIGADLVGANFGSANLAHSILDYANVSGAIFFEANLHGASLYEADLSGANFHAASLRGANLLKTNLIYSNWIGTKIENAIISQSNVYGANVWDLIGEFKEQKELIITYTGQPTITVDNIEIAQFIYLILNNKKLRHVINTLTSKTVLILGRFSISGRKAILDALRNKLREYDLVPIVFDFDRPTDKDFTETIKTLAGISYFVIADVTNPKSSPLELQATVPDYQIPFVPIIQEGESPFAMMVDLQKKYPWVLPTRSYDSIETLMSALKPGIIDPAVEMRNKLRLIKAQEQVTESLRDYVDKSL